MTPRQLLLVLLMAMASSTLAGGATRNLDNSELLDGGTDCCPCEAGTHGFSEGTELCRVVDYDMPDFPNCMPADLTDDYDDTFDEHWDPNEPDASLGWKDSSCHDDSQ
ncbi:expressed unknown protein [Seminavis robusta]|uniref:Uncharacterized protein n=1 Tax=Seminavis robusta TaxID=568900 RepID=A0A9N8H764_9STRA|nr:expressed unknown protein [Seminavis robusta]|eukprot:Sro194_g082780.1 n/a (108) ;mRNA; f:34801-35124